MIMRRRRFIALVGSSVLATAGGAAAQSASPPRTPAWAENAEREFRLGAGMGPKLMTEEEWTEHRANMRTLTGAERDAYRRQMHDKMAARARARGIDMPAVPGPGAAPGRGPGR